jgi:hypothetical protein
MRQWQNSQYSQEFGHEKRTHEAAASDASLSSLRSTVL